MIDQGRTTLADQIEATPEGRLEMAAARSAVTSIQLLNRAFEASGLQQKELAAKLGVTDGRVSQVLHGDGNLRVSTLARFLRACGYRLHVAALPADVGVAPLAVPRARSREARKGPRYAAFRTVACVSADGVSEEPVIQLSRSHPRTFFGEVYDAVVDLETGEAERPRTNRERRPTAAVKHPDRIHADA